MMTNNLKLNEPWWKSDFVVLDLEGTGFQHKEREGIVEIAALHISNGEILKNFYYEIIDPEIEIPPMVSRIHGLKNTDLIGKPVFNEINKDLLKLLNHKILIGHNVIVDYKLLKLKMPNYEPSLIIDTKKISKYFWRSESKHGLDNLIEKFKINESLKGLPIERGRHSAYYDAFATATIFLLMVSEKFSRNSSLQELIRIAKVEINSNNNIQGTLF